MSLDFATGQPLSLATAAPTTNEGPSRQTNDLQGSCSSLLQDNSAKLQFESLGLYGRNKETLKLKECLDRLETDLQKQFILLSGESGVGKTALSFSLQTPVKKLKGCFASGKFDRHCGPFTGIIGLVKNICREINVVQKRQRPLFEEIQENIKLELGGGADGLLFTDLIRVFPSLQQIVENDGEGNDGGSLHHFSWSVIENTGDVMSDTCANFAVSLEARNRFNYAFRIFIRIISSFFSPLVFVLDDLQWADASSLDLLEYLLLDHENKNLMVIAIYRPVIEVQSTTKTLQDVRDSITNKSGLRTTEIEIGNLDVIAVHVMLQDLLSSEDYRILRLAEICHAKTLGNAFYLIHFVSMLHENQLLKYNKGLLEWQWDEIGIENSTFETESVANLLKNQMSRLSHDNREILKFAAFLGSTFNQRMIHVLWRSAREELDPGGISLEQHMAPELVEENLISCEDAGFLECLGNETYSWVHDLLKDATMGLIPTNERHSFSNHIAEVLSVQLTDSELDGAIFLVANRFNKGLPPDDPWKRLERAKCNLQAAKKAVSICAYESASKYCSRGIKVLTTDRWSKDYELCLELYSLAAETHASIGSDKMEGYCKQVLMDEDRPLQDTLRIYNVRMDHLFKTNRPIQAAMLCLNVIKQYGCYFPENHMKIKMKTSLSNMRIKTTLKSRNATEVQSMPILTDEERIMQMALFDRLAKYFFSSERELLHLAVSKSIRWTLRYGLCEYSPAAFALMGILLAGDLSDLKGGAIYGNYSLLLLEKLNSKVIEPRTTFLVHSFVLHWSIPAPRMLQPLLNAYEVGMQTGDTESAMLSIYHYIVFGFLSGKPLDTIEHDCRIYSMQMKELKQDRVMNDCKLTWQMILNLKGNSRHKVFLSGEALDEEACTGAARKNPYLASMLKAHKLLIRSIFADYEGAVELSLASALDESSSSPSAIAAPSTTILPGSPFMALATFHRGLSLLAMAQKTKGAPMYKIEARKRLAKIHKWASGGNPNVKHYQVLLQAELAVVDNKKSAAKNLYKSAVEIATSQGFVQDAALANERFGEFLLHCMNDKEGAALRIKRACSGYSEWGAHGKVESLEEKYSNLLPIPDLRKGLM